ESGTGKELFAQAIHHASPRKLRPFVRINCSAIPKDLFESELFGYEEGAFTGARSGGKPGKFELAQGGTVFLDEVGDLPKEMQPKLLRVLEEKEFERVGGTSLIKADFRIVAATNQNLEEMLSTRALRKDLFYRLNVIHLHIPTLRERREDIIPLARHLLDRISEDLQTPRMKLAPESEWILSEHNWQGNVRELSNVMERIVCTFDGHGEVDVSDLPFSLKRSRYAALGPGDLRLEGIMAGAEREALMNALRLAKNNKARAADLLGIHRTHLYKKMKKHGISLS
ncbi:MAG: sigma 54-interacting transcriptional regulator, partial [Deltaproteobacteria bacterium]|nr:sigma 54-interacting transcriptional regulator [Deltaproteobacteria bacterium]